MNYKIKMKKDDFFKIHNRIAANDVNVLKDEVSFKVELGSYNIIKDSGYKYYLEDSFKIKFNYFMKKYHLLIIGLLFFFSLLYINSYRLDEKK
ncbi:MAG: hypothetical protein IJY14_01435 [Acholeplasmatales bacterium]|nr:hypothetical protein [Acholeplasmatales bacterium]